MRTEQLMGLSPAGKQYLENFYKSCGTRHGHRYETIQWGNGEVEFKDEAIQVSNVISVPASTFDGAYGGEYELDTYIHKDNHNVWITEYLQATQWSSGPMYFIALKNASGPIEETLWTEEEMEETM